MTIKPVPASRPWLRKIIWTIPPWMTWFPAVLAVIYGHYWLAYNRIDPVYWATSRDLADECFEATKLLSECRDYADYAAGIPIVFGLVGLCLMLMALAVWLGYVHMMLREGWAEGHKDAVVILLWFAAAMFVFMLLAFFGIYELHLFWPELPEPTPAPRIHLPPDKRV